MLVLGYIYTLSCMYTLYARVSGAHDASGHHTEIHAA